MGAHAPYIPSNDSLTIVWPYLRLATTPTPFSLLNSGTDHEERRVTLSLSRTTLSSYYTYTFKTIIPIYKHLDLCDLVSTHLIYSTDLYQRETPIPFTRRAPLFLRACRYLDQLQWGLKSWRSRMSPSFCSWTALNRHWKLLIAGGTKPKQSTLVISNHSPSPN